MTTNAEWISFSETNNEDFFELCLNATEKLNENPEMYQQEVCCNFF